MPPGRVSARAAGCVVRLGLESAEGGAGGVGVGVGFAEGGGASGEGFGEDFDGFGMPAGVGEGLTEGVLGGEELGGVGGHEFAEGGDVGLPGCDRSAVILGELATFGA